MLPRPLKQHVRAVDVCICEFVRVAKAEVDVRLGSEVENGIDSVLSQYTLDIRWRCYIALLECKVCLFVEDSGVVERCAVVEFVKGNDIVVWIRENQMAYKPAGSAKPLIYTRHEGNVETHSPHLPVLSSRRT